jgi:hypothetical protein
MVEASTSDSRSRYGTATKILCISSCRPFRKWSFFFSSVSVSSGAYLDRVVVHVLYHGHNSLPQVHEIVLHELDQSSWNVGLAELSLEFFPGDDVSFNLNSLDIFPPSTHRSRKELGGKQYLLIIADCGNLQVVLNGVNPIIDVKGFNALGENSRVGALETLQLRAGVSIYVFAIIFLAE